jgi:multidrug resistance efflux pump
LLVVASASGCTARRAAQRGAGGPKTMVVGRADLTERILLTGELEAVASESLVVPKTPQWNLSIRWLEADGTVVASGQKVAEFDNSAFANTLAEQKLAAAQSANELAAQLAQNDLAAADKTFEVDKARIALDKARTEASVAPDTLPRRVYQEKQLDVERAEAALAKAVDEEAAQRKSAALDIKVRQLALEKAQRDIQTAEAAIESVVLRAPRDGIVVIADHPWEGRKLETGDNVWVGLPVVRLPDLQKMKVNALLSDVDDGRIAVGMRATAYLDAHPDVPFPATVTEVSPVAREPSQKSWRRSFVVMLALDRTEPERMLPGMSVRVEVVGKSVQGALVAPRAAVDVAAKPPRLGLGDGTSVDLEDVFCTPQSCAITPPVAAADKVREGVVVRALATAGGA